MNPADTTAKLDKRTTMNGKPVLWLEAKTVINFKSLFGEKMLCDGLTFSTGTACAYSCSFCYVPSMFARTPYITEMLAKEGLRFDQVTIRRSNPIEVAKKQIFDAKGRPKFMQDKRVIYSSPLVDVAANMDMVRETVEMALLILANTGWTIRFLSKSNLLPKIAEELKDFKGPHNLLEELVKIRGIVDGQLYWVDMESNIRINDLFSIDLAAKSIAIFKGKA